MALTVPLVWGMGLVIAKGAIDHFPPILLMALRFSLTAFVLVWFVPIPKKHLINLFGIAIIAAAIQYSLTFSGLKGIQYQLGPISNVKPSLLSCLALPPIVLFFSYKSTLCPAFAK